MHEAEITEFETRDAEKEKASKLALQVSEKY
jgi:hypothetical protein